MRWPSPSHAAFLLVATVACGGTDPGAAAPPQVFTAPQVQPAPPPIARAPVIVERSAGEVAPWLARVVPQKMANALVDIVQDTQGFTHTVFVTNRGIFVLGATGMTGPLADPPGGAFAFAGPVGDDDAILGVNARGEVYVAPDAEAAQEASRYEPRAKVGSPTGMDAAGQVVAIATQGWVFVSLDAGKKFTKLALPTGASIKRILARADGVVVAQTEKDAVTQIVSSKRAGPFVKSSYQPRVIGRQGAVIRTYAGCDAALAADGTTWFAPDWKLGKPAETKRRNQVQSIEEALNAQLATDGPPLTQDPFGDGAYGSAMFGPSTRADLQPSMRLTTPLAPPAPPRPAAGKIATGAQRDCPGANGMALLSSNGTNDVPCDAAGCVANVAAKEPPRTMNETQFFDDGQCGPADVVKHADFGTTWTTCARGAKSARSPTLARVDHERGTLRAVRPPQDCRFVGHLNAGDGTWILCDENGTTKIVAVDDKDRFTVEGALPAALRTHATTVARDGTLALIATDRRVYVRTPAPIGTPGKWRPLAANLFAPIPLGRGAVLVARVRDTRSPSLAIGVERDGTFSPLTPEITVNAPVVELSLADDGRVILATDPGYRSDSIGLSALLDADKTKRFIVMNDGTLEPYDPSKGGASK